MIDLWRQQLLSQKLKERKGKELVSSNRKFLAGFLLAAVAPVAWPGETLAKFLIFSFFPEIPVRMRVFQRKRAG